MVQKESIILGLNRCHSAINIIIFGLTYVYYKAGKAGPLCCTKWFAGFLKYRLKS